MEKDRVRLMGLAAAVAVGVAASPMVGRVLSALAPFFTAYICASLTRPMGVWLSRKLRCRESWLSLSFGVVLLLSVTALTAFLGASAVSELSTVVGAVGRLAGMLGRYLPRLYEMLPNAAETVAGATAAVAGGLLRCFPRGISATVMWAVAYLYLMWRGDDALTVFLHGGCSARLREVLAALSAYLRAHLALMGVTFLMLWAGLSLLGIDGSASAAFLTALLDALPMIGCGAVLIPWAALELFSGSIFRGVGLISLLVLISLTRRILESHLIGRAVGLSPFLTLCAVYVGWQTAGLAGMVTLPLICALWIGKKDPPEAQ